MAPPTTDKKAARAVATPTKTRYIPAELLPNLHKYTYAGADHSLVSKYILQPYWNWLITLVPMWMAPNLVTLIGFGFIVANLCLTLWFSPDLTEPLPRWCYFFFGIGLFLYQSLDAIDGKQARRTGQSGPLGEMFDHGCDALNTTMSVITLAPVLGYGKSWWMLVSMGSALANFFLSTWEEYHTGILHLGAISGPVEGILIVVSVLLTTGVFGREMWAYEPFGTGTGLTLMHMSMYLGLAIICFNIYGSAGNVIRASRGHGESSTVPLLRLAPFVVSVALVAVWVAGNPEGILAGGGMVPLSLYITFAFGHLVGGIITAHVVHAPYPWISPMWVPSGVGAANAVIGVVFGVRLIPVEYDVVLLWTAFGFAATLYAKFALGVIADICQFLDIWCLTIKHPQKPKAD
ncbi:CDP-alcohol phosphatidyltransferase-domain-containing protein [Blastocladiella britannica]|nr:CDP-alcohol phosphatidyltransferase-domain-containing protein [Blastocladiella britannica]